MVVLLVMGEAKWELEARVLKKIPALTEADLIRRFGVAVRDAHAFGLTAIHDAGLDPASLAFFKR